MSITTTGQRVTRRLLQLFGVAALIFLLGPLAIVLLMSFSSAGAVEFPPPGYSFRWYEELVGDPRWRDAIQNSLLIGGVSTLFALMLGTLAATGLTRLTARTRPWLLGFFLSPMIVPPIVTAVALAIVYARFGISGSMIGLFIGHTIIVVPYVVLVMTVGLVAFDQRVEQMAWSLGATWFRAFRTVVFPMILPSLLAAATFAFIISFDEVIVTIFIAGVNDTVPKLMFTQLRDRIDPTVTALAAVLVGFSLVLMALSALVVRFSRRQGLVIPGMARGPAEK